MPREIKFRGWNKTTKTMLDLKAITPLILDIQHDGVFLPFAEEVELMQYTGLKDKNGKEIWESDIVAYYVDLNKDNHGYTKKGSRTANIEVEFEEGAFCINLNDVFVPGADGEYLGEIHEECEVIGNIHENPELLEQSA